MPTTYEPIATTTLGSAQTSVTFSSISGSYTDLIIVCNAKITSGNGETIRFQFNSDTGSNYSQTNLNGNGSVAGSDRLSNQTKIESLTLWSTDFSVHTVHINNYSNATTYKTALLRGSNPNQIAGATVGLWRNTNAINSVKIFVGGTLTMTANSTFTLYGIKAA